MTGEVLSTARLPSFARTALPGRVVFGPGSLQRLASEADGLGVRHVLLIVAAYDRNLSELSLPALGARVGLLWEEVRRHVPRELAGRAVAAARANAVDAIVTVGGGSTTGLGKAVAVETGLPLIAVPTTYAGSEMTPIYGLTSDGEKRTAKDARALPALAIYDPELVRSLPPAVVGPSGMNALAHCVEALWADEGDPVTDVLALEATRLLAEHLAAAYESDDIGARGQLQLAACLAGNALGTVGTSIHHSLCHLMGGMYDLPHAETHAVVLPYAVAFASAALPEARERLAVALATTANDVDGAIWDLGARVGTPAGLKALGMTREQVSAAARAAVDRELKSPRPLDLPAVEGLLADAWAGARPSSA